MLLSALSEIEGLAAGQAAPHYVFPNFPLEFPRFLSKSKENDAIAVFFSEAQIALIVSRLPLIAALILASQDTVLS